MDEENRKGTLIEGISGQSYTDAKTPLFKTVYIDPKPPRIKAQALEKHASSKKVGQGAVPTKFISGGALVIEATPPGNSLTYLLSGSVQSLSNLYATGKEDKKKIVT